MSETGEITVTIEIDVPIEYMATAGIPGKLFGPPADSYPAEAAECEFWIAKGADIKQIINSALDDIRDDIEDKILDDVEQNHEDSMAESAMAAEQDRKERYWSDNY